jgi:hypothetical protein
MLDALFVSFRLQIYDRDRQDRDLVMVYADNAQFSLSYQPEPAVSNIKYTEQNRNILSLGVAKLRGPKEVALLRTKPVSIVTALHALPASKHDRHSFVADVVNIPCQSAELKQGGGLLSLTVRGQFLETGMCTRRHVARCVLCSAVRVAVRCAWQCAQRINMCRWLILHRYLSRPARSLCLL